MIEQRYVKKRKRRKLVAVLSTFATMGMASLILVAFLGRHTGSFTVSLNTGDVKISLGNKMSFGDDEGSSYLKVDKLAAFDESTYLAILEEGEGVLDSEESPYTLGYDEDAKTMNFFKYTFFVKNLGAKTADYELSIKIKESTPSVNGQYLDNELRVMFYANDGYNTDSHNREVYALRSETPNTDLNGDKTFDEYISMSPMLAQEKGVEFPGFAKQFESEKVVATIPVKYFDRSDMNRYTIVTWLEGYDPQSDGREAPEGASIKLGVEINAYENK